MTREEAIKRLKEARNTIQPFQYVNEAIDYAVKTLEQEPCEDAVSKQGVAKILLKYVHNAEGKAFAEFLVSQINDLPPVNPQKPCEDVISRQAVLDSIHANCVYENEYNLTAKHIEDAVKQLPPVTPQPKTGHWIEGEIWEDTDGGWGRWQKCSVCRQSKHYKTNFCPDCGAKMLEVEE